MVTRSESAKGYHRAAHVLGSPALAVATAAILLVGCQPETKVQAPEVRPVRTVTVMKRDVGETVTYTRRIEAEMRPGCLFASAAGWWNEPSAPVIASSPDR
jgi:hypothetical protein